MIRQVRLKIAFDRSRYLQSSLVTLFRHLEIDAFIREKIAGSGREGQSGPRQVPVPGGDGRQVETGREQGPIVIDRKVACIHIQGHGGVGIVDLNVLDRQLGDVDLGQRCGFTGFRGSGLVADEQGRVDAHLAAGQGETVERDVLGGNGAVQVDLDLRQRGSQTFAFGRKPFDPSTQAKQVEA